MHNFFRLKYTSLVFLLFFGTLLKSQKCDMMLTDVLEKGEYMIAPKYFDYFNVWLKKSFKDVCYEPNSKISNRFNDLIFLKQQDFKIGNTGIAIHINPKLSDRKQPLSFTQKSFNQLDENDLTNPNEYNVFDFEKKLQVALMHYNYIESDALTGYVRYISTDPGNKVEALIRDIEKKYKIKLDIQSKEDNEIADEILDQIHNQTPMEEHQFLYDYFIKADTWEKEEKNFFYFVRKAIFQNYFGTGKVLPDPNEVDELIARKNTFQIKNNDLEISLPPEILSVKNKNEGIRFSAKAIEYRYVQTTKDQYIFIEFSQFVKGQNTLFSVPSKEFGTTATDDIEKVILKIYKDKIDVLIGFYEYKPNLIFSKATTL